MAKNPLYPTPPFITMRMTTVVGVSAASMGIDVIMGRMRGMIAVRAVRMIFYAEPRLQRLLMARTVDPQHAIECVWFGNLDAGFQIVLSVNKRKKCSSP